VSLATNQQPHGRLYNLWMEWAFKMILGPFLWCQGFTSVRTQTLRIRDVLGDYTPTAAPQKQAPIVVSNHVGIYDMFYFFTKNVSFIAKKAIASQFYIGMFAITKQCIFLDRGDIHDRSKVLQLISDRAARIRAGEPLPSIMIFPEGTVSNGRTLLSFKRGAFACGAPIKIFVLKFNAGNTQVVSSLCNMPTLASFIIGLSQLRNSLEVVEFEDNFDPEWVYSKYGLNRDDDEAWVKVADEVKKLMSFASGFHSTEDSLRTIDDFEQKCRLINKEILQSKQML